MDGRRRPWSGGSELPEHGSGASCRGSDAWMTCGRCTVPPLVPQSPAKGLQPRRHVGPAGAVQCAVRFLFVRLGLTLSGSAALLLRGCVALDRPTPRAGVRLRFREARGACGRGLCSCCPPRQPPPRRAAVALHVRSGRAVPSGQGVPPWPVRDVQERSPACSSEYCGSCGRRCLVPGRLPCWATDLVRPGTVRGLCLSGDAGDRGLLAGSVLVVSLQNWCPC
jgi:hypothetical protein